MFNKKDRDSELNNGESAFVQAAAEGPASPAVLVVDDMQVNLIAALGLLARHGIHADTAASGEEALEKAASLFREGRQYDLIFMDHMMPGMDGLETTKRYREMERKQSSPQVTPVIAFSANAAEGVEEIFLAAGMNDFISKPVKPDLLNRALIRWLPPEKIKPAPKNRKPEEPRPFSTLPRRRP